MGEDFPGNTKLWTGGDFKCMGYGIKYKTIVFIKIQVFFSALKDRLQEAHKQMLDIQL